MTVLWATITIAMYMHNAVREPQFTDAYGTDWYSDGSSYYQKSDIRFDGSTGSRVCASLYIVNDNRIENDEVFTVILQAVKRTTIVPANSTVTITIKDDAGQDLVYACSVHGTFIFWIVCVFVLNCSLYLSHCRLLAVFKSAHSI